MNKAENGSLRWEEAFAGLKEWIGRHPEIRVTARSLAVPKAFREEFYGRIDEVEAALAEAVLGNQMEEGRRMAARCDAMRKRLAQKGGLKEFRLAAALENLIVRPETALARPVLGLVLDAVQQGLTAEEVEDRAVQLLPVYARDLLRNAYEAWAYCGIVEALNPVRFYGVSSPDTVKVILQETDTLKVGWQVTSPERRHPEAVFETADGRTFAMKMEVGIELEYYGTKINKKQDFSSGGNTADQIAHRVLLLYQFENRDRVDLLANRDQLYIRPNDLYCEFLLPSEMEQSYLASQFVRRINTVRSRRPVQVLTLDERGEFPEGMAEDPAVASFERVQIGYEEEKLAEIAAKLR